MEDIEPRIRQLAADIDRLETALAPLLLGGGDKAPSAAVSLALRLPLLDKAKLHVLAGFALESTLYCGLGLAGVDARSHAVYRELQRVRQYMGKIDAAEKGSQQQQPSRRLDKSAAIRFIKADMDSPATRTQLDQLLKEEQAAAAATAAAAADAGADAGVDADAGAAAPPRGQKRGGSAATAAAATAAATAAAADQQRTGNNNLAKRPKHGGGGSGAKETSKKKGRSHRPRAT